MASQPRRPCLFARWYAVPLAHHAGAQVCFPSSLSTSDLCRRTPLHPGAQTHVGTPVALLQFPTPQLVVRGAVIQASQAEDAFAVAEAFGDVIMPQLLENCILRSRRLDHLSFQFLSEGTPLDMRM